jgi:hypothetical protein
VDLRVRSSFRVSRVFRVFHAVIAVGAAFGWGCSSVPEVKYSDQDASTIDSGGGGGDGGGGPRDGGTDAPKASCPGSPPAGGVCCGNTVCEGCATTDCAACAAAACTGGDLCCPVGASGKVICKGTSCK